MAEQNTTSVEHPDLHVTAPRRGGVTRYRAKVVGLLHRAPPGREVQVLVHANDGKWYLQAPVTRSGERFETEVCLGFEHAPGKVYFLVAGVPDDKITTSPLDTLPPGLWSQVVRVRRRED